MTEPVLIALALFTAQMIVLYLVVRLAVRGALRDSQQAIQESIRMVLLEMDRRRAREISRHRRDAATGLE